MTMDGSKMSDSMNLENDAVFLKKSFYEVDNNDMKTILVEKIEFLTRLCFRMHEKIETMEFRTKEIEANQRLWQESQFEKDFRDVTMACVDKRIGTHKVVTASQDDLLKYSTEEDLLEKEAPVKVDRKVSDDRKVSWAERLFKKGEDGRKVKVEVQGKVKTEDEVRKGWKSAPV